MKFQKACCTTPFKYGREVLGPSGMAGQYDEKAVDSFFISSAGKGYVYLSVPV